MEKNFLNITPESGNGNLYSRCSNRSISNW